MTAMHPLQLPGVYFGTFLLFCISGVFCRDHYTVNEDLTGQSFLDAFNFNSYEDPNSGYVNYLTKKQATKNCASGNGYACVVNNGKQVKLNVDATSIVSNSSRGRNSVFLESQKSFGPGSLLVADMAHVPGTTCGVWPSFWSINDYQNSTYPLYGEIDIYEGVNTQRYNVISLHTDTSVPCVFTTPAKVQSGSFLDGNTNCSLATDAGCEVSGGAFGDGFNAVKGGVYAMQLDVSSIRVWWFPRAKIPSDLTSMAPDPSSWGKPVANFESKYGGCNINKLFENQSIIFKIDFCGDNGSGLAWTEWSNCVKYTGAATCEAFVQNSPSFFKDAYFLINRLTLYNRA